VQDQGRIHPHLAYRLDEINRIDRERLEGLEVRLKEWGASKVHKEVEFGRPDPLIVEKIRKEGYSMLVIASQGRGYTAEAFLGRVANHVVHRSTIPVLWFRGIRRRVAFRKERTVYSWREGQGRLSPRRSAVQFDPDRFTTNGCYRAQIRHKSPNGRNGWEKIKIIWRACEDSNLGPAA
jgi:Universal stress protein family